MGGGIEVDTEDLRTRAIQVENVQFGDAGTLVPALPPPDTLASTQAALAQLRADAEYLAANQAYGQVEGRRLAETLRSVANAYDRVDDAARNGLLDGTGPPPAPVAPADNSIPEPTAPPSPGTPGAPPSGGSPARRRGSATIVRRGRWRLTASCSRRVVRQRRSPSGGRKRRAGTDSKLGGNGRRRGVRKARRVRRMAHEARPVVAAVGGRGPPHRRRTPRGGGGAHPRLPAVRDTAGQRGRRETG